MTSESKFETEENDAQSVDCEPRGCRETIITTALTTTWHVLEKLPVDLACQCQRQLVNRIDESRNFPLWENQSQRAPQCFWPKRFSLFHHDEGDQSIRAKMTFGDHRRFFHAGQV